MTNKEKYKQAFSVLQASGELSMEVDSMMLNSKKARVRTAIAAAAACILLAGGGGSIAYAADIGGIQRIVQVWIDGDCTNAVIDYDAEQGSIMLDLQKEDGTIEEIGGGGVAFDENGSERPLTEGELLEEMNAPDVAYNEDGTVWVYYYDQKIEITDRFENDVCYVKLSNGDETLYMTVKYQGGYSTSPHKYVSPGSFN